MYPSFFTISSLVLACYTSLSAAAEADCLGQTGVLANQSSAPTNITFDGGSISLNNNITCAFVDASSTLNITTNVQGSVLDSFGRALNVSFGAYENIFGHNTPSCGPGSTANRTKGESFLTLSNRNPPDLSVLSVLRETRLLAQRCYTGVVEKACFDSVAIGTPVMACLPVHLNEDGSIDENNITPYPSTTASPTKSTPTPTATPTSGAVDLLLGHGGWRSSLSMVMMVVTVLRMGDYFVAL